jgi:SAM-dependent methyltransferase
LVRLDRLEPRFFHQDYWHLRAIRKSLQTLLDEHGEELRGKRALDYGSSESPYVPLFAGAGIELLAADIAPVTPPVLEIDPSTGRVALSDASVDCVLSTQVLEHVPNVLPYLLEAFRVLKPAGMLYLSTHGTWQLHRFPTDMRRWTIDGLRYEIEQAGFIVERVDPYVGRLATATYHRMVALSEFLRATRVLSPLRGVTNAMFNVRMGIEDFFTTRHGLEMLQQLLVVTARRPPAK